MTLQLAFIRWDLYRYLQASSAKYDEIINRGVFTLSSTGWKISGPTKQKFGVTIITNMLHSFWTTIFFWVTSHEPHEECGCFTCRPVIGICEQRKIFNSDQNFYQEIIAVSSDKKVFAPIATEFPNILLKVVWKKNKEQWSRICAVYLIQFDLSLYAIN